MMIQFSAFFERPISPNSLPPPLPSLKATVEDVFVISARIPVSARSPNKPAQWKSFTFDLRTVRFVSFW